MNKLDKRRRIQVIASLVEGNSIRATVRMTGVAKNTIVELLEDIGAECLDYQDKAFNNLTCKRLQCDEIWSFVGAKAKNVPAEKQGDLALATFGRGLLLMPILNLFRVGTLADAMQKPPLNLLPI